LRYHWQYLTIPSILFVAIETQWRIWLYPPRSFMIHFAGFLLLNLYGFIIASFSKMGLKYLIVLLPYAFLPSIWRVFSVLGVNPIFSLFLGFIISIYTEMAFFEELEIGIDICRLGALTFIGWVIEKWLIGTLALL